MLDAVRNGSKSKLRPPTSIIPGNESRRWREGASTRRDAEIAHQRRLAADLILLRFQTSQNGLSDPIISQTIDMFTMSCYARQGPQGAYLRMGDRRREARFTSTSSDAIKCYCGQ